MLLPFLLFTRYYFLHRSSYLTLNLAHQILAVSIHDQKLTFIRLLTSLMQAFSAELMKIRAEDLGVRYLAFHEGVIFCVR